MTNVPVGPNRVSPSGQSVEDAPKEPWRESLAASSRSAGNSFKAPANNQKTKRGKLKLAILAVVALLLIAFAGTWFMGRSDVASQIDGSRYQAVFFTNGQVYFGKLQKLSGSYYKLTDIFYIQAKQATPKADSENPQATSDTQALSEPELVKLGEEIHGPEDAMIISQEQILFFENLKKDGKVTNAISQYRAEKQ